MPAGTEAVAAFAFDVDRAAPVGAPGEVVFISKDGGPTWPIKRMIYPEYFGYSCLTVLPDGRVGCLYEREGTARTSLGLYDLNWLMGDTL